MKLLLICLLMCSVGFADGVGKIAGTVVAKDWKTILGATVKILEIQQCVQVSNPAGSFVILGIAPGKYTLEFSAVGYETVQIDSVFVKSDLTTLINASLFEKGAAIGNWGYNRIYGFILHRGSIHVEKGFGSISGQIVDEHWEGIVGANGQIAETGQGTTVRESDGSFFIPRVWPGKYTLNVASLGYARKALRDVVVSGYGTTTDASAMLATEQIQSTCILTIDAGRSGNVVLDEPYRVKRMTGAELARRLGW